MEKRKDLLENKAMKDCKAMEVASETVGYIIAKINSGDFDGAEHICVTTNRLLIIAKLPSEYLNQMAAKLKYCVDYSTLLYSTLSPGKDKRRMNRAINVINGSIYYLQYCIKIRQQSNYAELSVIG